MEKLKAKRRLQFLEELVSLAWKDGYADGRGATPMQRIIDRSFNPTVQQRWEASDAKKLLDQWRAHGPS